MSGRIRTIKPEWLEDELLASAPDHVRLLSVGLILMADDHGRGRASVNFVAGDVWRYDRSPEVLTKVREGLAWLSRVRFIRLYEVDGQAYFEIRNWLKHQKVQHVGKERVPAPEPPKSNENNSEVDSHETLMRVPVTLTPDLRPHTSDLIPPTSILSRYGDSPRPELSSPQAAPTPAAEPEVPKPPVQVQEVFNAYLSGWRQHVGHGAEPVLTAKRERAIKARLKEHPPDVVCRAARGIWASSWHREQSQTSIDLAMRDAAHVERFSGEPPKQAGSVMRPSRPVQRSPGYQQTEERKRAEFLAENARKQQELGLIPDEYGQVF